MIPETQYARAGDFHLAYQVLGDGPPDLVLADQWFSHMDAQWNVRPLADLRERLARFGRLIMFDKRGVGLSDPVPIHQLPTIEEWIDDLRAVMDAVGSERAAVVTNIGGGLMAMAFAAAHPERVSHLVLVDCFARFLAAPDFAIGAPAEALDQALADADVGTGKGVMLDYFAPSVAAEPYLREAWSRYERQAASPGSTVAMVRLIYLSDVRPTLGAIRVPTLVIHRTEARGFGIEHGRYLAAQIPGAKLVELPGIDNLIWAGDQDAIVTEIEAFITGVRPAPEPNRVLATVLFTDIVDSTARAIDMGDRRWRELLADHDRSVRTEVDRGGGRCIKSTGDGVLATFDGPARSILAARAIRTEAARLGLQIRAGLHTGEIELVGDDIAGIAVHVASRVAGLATAGEILTSSTVKDLTTGAGIRFADRGAHGLKGLEGEWRLYRVVDT